MYVYIPMYNLYYFNQEKIKNLEHQALYNLIQYSVRETT
jgi:hypothetical protein